MNDAFWAQSETVDTYGVGSDAGRVTKVISLRPSSAEGNGAVAAVPLRRIGQEVQRLFNAPSEEIFSGGLAAGAKLSETELARRYGISRGPLREAIRRLEERGLV